MKNLLEQANKWFDVIIPRADSQYPRADSCMARKDGTNKVSEYCLHEPTRSNHEPTRRELISGCCLHEPARRIHEPTLRKDRKLISEGYLHEPARRIHKPTLRIWQKDISEGCLHEPARRCHEPTLKNWQKDDFGELSSRASSQDPRADSSVDPELQRLVLKQNLLLEIELQRSYLNPNGLKWLLTVQNSLGKIQDTINTALKSDLQRLRKYKEEYSLWEKEGFWAKTVRALTPIFQISLRALKPTSRSFQLPQSFEAWSTRRTFKESQCYSIPYWNSATTFL